MSDITTDLGYTGQRACAAAGITYRQLDYWARTDLIRPSVHDAEGSGSRRRYSYRDILLLATMKTLLDTGVRLERIRGLMFDIVMPSDPTGSVLVISDRAARIMPNILLHKILNQTTGVLTVVPLTSIQKAVDQRLETS